jgi:ribonuclease HI
MKQVQPYNDIQTLAKSDTVNIYVDGGLTDAVLVGGAGIVVAVLQNDTTVTITGVIAGALLPIAIKRVNSTTTSATNMIALRYR